MAYSYRSLAALAILCCSLPLANAQFQPQGILLFGAGGSGTQSLALSADGTTALVGEPSANNGVGAVAVFTRSAGVWSQQGTLVSSDSVGAAKQGWAVALSADGNIALVGGPGDNQFAGAAWLFARSGGIWTEQGSKLTGSGAAGPAHQGMSVGLSSDGNTVLIGGPDDNVNQGAAWVFTRSGLAWTQQGSKLTGSGAAGAAEQGWSVALSGDGNTALLGGWVDNGTVGATWVFARSAGVWSQQGPKLTGSDAAVPAAQGWSVALSGDGNTALVGGYNDNQGAGAAWVYTRSGGAWTQQGSKLTGTGSIGPATLGSSVALSADGNTALVGGDSDVGGVGAAWMFDRSASTWSQQGNKLVGSDTTDALKQGWSVALSEDSYTALVGSSNNITLVFAAPKPSSTNLTVTQNPSPYGQAITYTATVTAGATGTVAFSIDNLAQPAVVLNGGAAQFSIANLSPGTHTITAAYSGDSTFAPSNSNTVTQTIQALGAISMWANTLLNLDGSGRLPVTLSTPAPAAGLTIALSSSNPANVSVTPSVFIPAGKTAPNAQPTITGVNVGSASITATALGYTPTTQSAIVTATILFPHCCLTVFHSTSGNAVLTLSAPAPSTGFTVQLASGNTGVATVPATVTFAPGATSVNVPITGVAVGATTITASVPTLSPVTVKVTVQ